MFMSNFIRCCLALNARKQYSTNFKHTNFKHVNFKYISFKHWSIALVAACKLQFLCVGFHTIYYN